MNHTKLTSSPEPLNLHDHWVLLAPRGDHPHAEGLQRVDAQALKRLVHSFHGLLGCIKRALVGRPVYRGHPDTPSLANHYPDRTSYGIISELQERPAGLYARITLTEAGAQLVRGGIRWLSPYWKAEHIATSDSGTKIFRPVELLSVGLTAQPNIPGEALANTRPHAGILVPKTAPLSAHLHAHYPLCLRALRSQQEIRSFISEKRSAGLSYDDAFSCLFNDPP